jgi:hypothetical protein
MPKSRRATVQLKATKEDATKVLNSLWYTVAQRLVERIIMETDLDEERSAALRRSALRPMDFRLELQ